MQSLKSLDHSIPYLRKSYPLTLTLSPLGRGWGEGGALARSNYFFLIQTSADSHQPLVALEWNQ
jgi:hypothetical protein